MSNQNGNGGPPAGLHFLKALGHVALAVGHVAFSEGADDNEAQETARPRRRRRIASFRAGGGGSGSCCRGKSKG